MLNQVRYASISISVEYMRRLSTDCDSLRLLCCCVSIAAAIGNAITLLFPHMYSRLSFIIVFLFLVRFIVVMMTNVVIV